MGESHDKCEESLHLVYHYLDGELTEEKRVLIQQHIDDCPPCFEAFDFEAELRVVVKRRKWLRGVRSGFDKFGQERR